ncbi:uncharacterized protein LOC135687036 [Rhopilema esculentum]|uniref:uncharacterized protein LOC135687036 n=1 Tax=Rhopilema esculentum TaxID=499914 RepID=UPI0031DB6642|eukprot:gene6064-11436_t
MDFLDIIGYHHRRQKRVVAEHLHNESVYRRIITCFEDWNCLREAIIGNFGDILVNKIANATGLSKYDVKHYRHPKIIAEVMSLSFQSENGQVVEIIDVEDLKNNMAVFVEITTKNGSEIPPGPYRIWCPVHSEGQGYLALGESAIGVANYPLTSRGTTANITRMFLEPVPGLDLYNLRIQHQEQVYYVQCIENAVFAQLVVLGSPFPEKAAFHVIKQTECDYFYFILENESSSNNHKSMLKIGDKDLMVVETLDHDPRDLGSYLDQAFLFALCLDVKARRTVSKQLMKLKN